MPSPSRLSAAAGGLTNDAARAVRRRPDRIIVRGAPATRDLTSAGAWSYAGARSGVAIAERSIAIAAYVITPVTTQRITVR